MSKKRKTKSQKVIAQLRHQIAQNNTPVYNLSQIKQNITYTDTNKDASKIIQPTSKPELLIDYRLIKKDLLKTLILSLLIVISELVLYFKLS